MEIEAPGDQDPRQVVNHSSCFSIKWCSAQAGATLSIAADMVPVVASFENQSGHHRSGSVSVIKIAGPDLTLSDGGVPRESSNSLGKT
jgi:hypothetical protein